MDTIFTTKQQLFHADKARYSKQYVQSLPDPSQPTLDDILELPIKDRSPRLAWVTVASPEGFGEPHTIKLHFSTMEGLPCEGVCYFTREDCMKDIISLYMHKARHSWDDIMEALNLHRENPSNWVMCKHPDRPELLDNAVQTLIDYINKATSLMAPLVDRRKQEAAELLAEWEREYEDAPKGTPEEVVSDGYIYLPVVFEGGESGCFRARRHGVGFCYQMLAVHDYVANWYTISHKVVERIKHDPHWCAVMHPIWREAVYQKHEQVF